MPISRIAVVNDDTTFLEMMQQLLTEEGYNVMIWKVGSTAHEMLRREQPDLIILDIRMEQPEAGWQLLELLMLDPETRDINTMVCSADRQALNSKAENLQKHGIGMLEKPFDLEDLLAAISRFDTK